VSKGLLLSLDPGPGTEWEKALERAAAVLREGGVVSFATDTYYALGADPLNDSAVDRVFRIKRRDRSSPLPVLVGGVEQARAVLGGTFPRAVMPLLEACWPGPLTLVLPARRQLPAGVAGPDGTVGLRWPDWPIAEALLERFGGAITGSSANRSGNGGSLCGAAVPAGLGGEVDLVLDTGPSPGGPGSTVAGFVQTGGTARLRLIREGRISADSLARLSGLAVDSSAAGDDRI
jgi:L-threonylcarbamoyladenylate synthase